MSVQETTSPVDESVRIPDSVKRAAALAESFYKSEPSAEPPATVYSHAPLPPGNTDPDRPINIVAAPEPMREQTPAQPPNTSTPDPVVQAHQSAPPVTPEQWEHRYHSMRGRYEQSQTTIGSMQEQLQEMGNELVRTQENIQRLQGDTQTRPQTPQTQTFVTAEDKSNYGEALLDVVARQAKEAVAPELSRLEQENQQLRQTQIQNAKRTMYAQLDSELPNWREVNVSERFKVWLRLRDVYSGAVRQQMLNNAVQAAQAPRVIAFFKGFLAEEQATGQVSTDPQNQPAYNAPPRQPAVHLETLAAPGKARPATGDSQVSVDKPIYTRAQVAGFYDNVRKGVYAGRDAAKASDEALIFAAQREGRIR